MKNFLLIASLTVALSVAASVAQAATVVERSIPFDTVVAGCGEDIHVSGSLLGVFTETQSTSGGLVLSFHFQPQGVTGIGLTTGKTYRATGLTRETTVIVPTGGLVDTFVNQFNIVGTAGAQTYDVREIFHITVTPSGDIAAFVDNFSISC